MSWFQQILWKTVCGEFGDRVFESNAGGGDRESCGGEAGGVWGRQILEGGTGGVGGGRGVGAKDP